MTPTPLRIRKKRIPNLGNTRRNHTSKPQQVVTRNFGVANSNTNNIPIEALDPPSTTSLSYREERLLYFREHYDVMTGIRIAGTLGGFFLIVLLTLLYKSKCKKVSSIATPTQESLERLGIGMNELPLYVTPDLLLTSPSQYDIPVLLSSNTEHLNNLLNPYINIRIIQPTPRNLSPANSELFSANQKRRKKSSDSLLQFLHIGDNLKWVDDTSSENLPRFSDEESPSIISDSVFTFDHRVNRKGSIFSDEDDEWSGGLRLSCATAQVHHRDSFCSSEPESEYYESRKRRSSSTQTTFSDIRNTLRFSTQTPILHKNSNIEKSPLCSPLLEPRD